MIIVTGAAGFIGTNLVQALNAQGYQNIIIVDDLKDGKKFLNLRPCQYSDYWDIEEANAWLKHPDHANKIKAIFHQGACSDTTEWDGRYMMHNNFTQSKLWLNFAVKHQIPFIYASSAAVYGNETTFKESPEYEKPVNVYGYSKLAFDNYVRQYLSQHKHQTQIVGLRYFNVYGQHEQHKGKMASVAYHLHNQMKDEKTMRLFEGCDGYDNGEQRRDFIHVDDVVSVNLWFLKHPRVSGIFNCGTGQSEPFNAIATAVKDYFQSGEVKYVPFPEHLKGAYQSYTQADIQALRHVGYDKSFKTVSQGVNAYMHWLSQQDEK